LIGHPQAEAARLAWGIFAESLSPDQHLAVIGFYKTAGNSEKRRFAGAVLAHDSVDLACATIQTHVGQGLHCAELAGKIAKLKYRLLIPVWVRVWHN
jgi:hypothetical protein